MITTAAIVVAAGRGTRAGGATAVPKQYRLLAGRPVLAHSLGQLVRHPGIDAVLVVYSLEDVERYRQATANFADLLHPAVPGAETRQGSVRAGLEALASLNPARVLIHDAARPFLHTALIDDLLAALATAPAAIAAEPVSDTLKQVGAAGRIERTVDRSGLWRAQTPQAFDYRSILEAHRRATLEGREDFTDDAALAEWVDLPVQVVPNGSNNMKLTTAEDFAIAEQILAARAGAVEPRIGTGFDVHRFAEGDHVWLCGVAVPHTHRLDGHSDADVGLHALTDALLGAIGDGDIGQHFPPSDAQWRGAPSRIFLADAAERVRKRGGRITNVDVTLLCETPKVGPHRDAMRAAIAEVLAIDASRVGIKATTMERMGFIGRGEGIAAMASATVLLPIAAP